MKNRRNISKWKDVYDIEGDCQCFPSCGFYRRTDVVELDKKIKKLEADIQNENNSDRYGV